MKVLVIVAHQNLDKSRANKRFVEEIKSKGGITVYNLYDKYKDENIDVAEEQKMLASHDRIIFQYPTQWYSVPPLMKKWFDQVLTYGWAYGNGGDKLVGKEFMVATTTGGIEKAYIAGGEKDFSVCEFIRPIQGTVKTIGGKYMSPFVLHNAMGASADELSKASKDYVSYISA